MLRNVAVLYHPRRKNALQEAEWLSANLSERGIAVALGNAWDDERVVDLCCARELVVTFGGDGTIIRIARMAALNDVPVLGINLGRVGFLAEMTPEALHHQVDALAAGEYWVEERILLGATWSGGGEHDTFLSLNEVAVMRGVSPRAIHVCTMLDDEEFTTFTADGVLIATATGSTAYSLAAGGPVLYPESRDFMITPVAPHLHIGRSIIVRSDTTVTLTIETDRTAVMSVDGSEERPLDRRHKVTVCRSKRVARFARFGPSRYFYTALADRLR